MHRGIIQLFQKQSFQSIILIVCIENLKMMNIENNKQWNLHMNSMIDERILFRVCLIQ